MKKRTVKNEKNIYRFNFYKIYLKRTLDIIFSAISLILLSPFFILISFLIMAEDYGPVFFRQKRVGKNQKIFEILKFRTMCVNAEKSQEIGKEVIGKDIRITRIGYLLRRFKIDELPQLINILKGDMSIIGPRPSLPEYLSEYEEWEKRRFLVEPGLSGLAQVNGNIYLSRKQKSRYDVHYVEKLSFFLDLRIVCKTFMVVIFGEEKFKE